MKKIFIILSVGLLFSSCEKSRTPRVYIEETETPAVTSTKEATDPHAGFSQEQLAAMLKENTPEPAAETQTGLTWTVPESWEEKPGNGMRIASFSAKDDPAAIDCSIVTLGPGAGGINENIVRWLGQLNIPAPPEAEINSFVEEQETLFLKHDHTALVLNFSTLQYDADAATPSMLAAIIDTPQQRIFVKMTASKDNIAKYRSSFKALVQSLDFH